MEEMRQAPPAIFKAISGVIADVGAVGKDKVNKQQGFKFRSIDDVYNALHPALAKNKVFIVPDILERSVETIKTRGGTEMNHVTCQIKFTFFAEDGSSIESTLVGEALDTGDKATNKAMAIAYKYACFQVFCIPTEEMLDPDESRPELEQEQKAKTSGKSKTAGVDKKAEKKDHGSGAQEPENTGTKTEKVTQEMLGKIHAELARTGVKEETILKLFKVKSMEDMTTESYEKVMKKFQATPDKQEDTDE